MRTRALFLTALVLMLCVSARGQKLPDKIRGYKVHNINVAVKDHGDTATKDEREVLVKLGKPKLSVNGPLSVAIEVGAEITVMRQNGKVDFVTFHDFRVNGIAVEIEEYTSEFSFKKKVPVSLPKLVRLNIGIVGVAKAAYQELIESKKEWDVTGTVFVFGRSKKFGFSFKRVVPVRIEMKVKNPLAN